jgi:hypothetical protein
MEKHFYRKIYNITLCNFWHRSLSWQDTQHSQNLDTEDLQILRYFRSSFFTFLFFMQKLSGTSSGKNNKSCGIFHHESNKTKFAFFWFVYNFLRNLQESAKCTLLFELQLAVRPLRFLDSYAYALVLRLTPWKETSPRNVSPRAVAGAGGANSGELVAGLAREARGKGLWATRVRFAGSVGVKESPAVGRTGARWRWPPRLPAPASLRPAYATGGGGRFQEG